MSKRHFEALAARLRELRPPGSNKHGTARAKHLHEGMLSQWQEMVRGIAAFCADQNPHFDRERFLEAAGVDE